jgi:hypothetical protein
MYEFVVVEDGWHIKTARSVEHGINEYSNSGM